MLVCIHGSGNIEHNGTLYAGGKGNVWLLPAEVGKCSFQPDGEVIMLQIAIPVKVDNSNSQPSVDLKA